MRTQKIALSGLMLCACLTGVALTGTGCAGTAAHRSTGAYLDDKGVSTRVKTALFRDPVVSGFDVHVNTFRGDVQLSGFVDSPEQKERAAEVARAVNGVRMVTNNLEVKPGAAAMGTAGSSIQGTSTQTVPDSAVRNDLNQPQTTVPPAVRYDNTDNTTRIYATPPEASTREDRVNRMQQNQALPPANTRDLAPVQSTESSPQPAYHDNVQINAADGKATLQGTVRTESERAAIEQKVRDIPGIRSVDNELQVIVPR